MSIYKHVHDHNTTGIVLESIRNRFRSCSRDSSVVWICSFLFDLLWFPARRCDIFGTFAVTLVVFVVLDSLLGVLIALCF